MSTPTEKQIRDLEDRVSRLEAALLEAMFRRVSRHEAAEELGELDAALTAGKCAYEDAAI